MRARRGLVLAAALALLAGCATTSDPGGSPTGGGTPAPTTASPEPSTSPEPGPTSDAEVPAELTIVLDETGSGVTRTMTLTCAPTGGDHPDAAAACATLAAVGVEAFNPPPKDEMCTEQWGGPQVATVEGTVDGESVRARFSRTNGCEISRWDAVATILGSPGGAM
jgi:hypothetical protein